MEQRVEINLSLVIILSAAVHAFIILAFFAPQFSAPSMRDLLRERASAGGMRDVIVNINADDSAVETDATLLSDRDSSARGHITKDYGDTWLNNSREFTLPKKGSKGENGGSAGSASSRAASSSKIKSASADDEFPVSITLLHNSSLSGGGVFSASESEWTRIPDKKGIDKKNALFLSNDGAFSFNTKKVADFEYFRSMKNRIASNWFPPSYATGIMPETASSQTGRYTPGYTMLRMIPSGEVHLYFTMDRQGNVRDVVLVESQGNESLDQSCLQSIRNSKSFGPVPKDIPGELVVIPFIFGYYVR
ncbi:MAG: energy transducer TonB family protein [Spirochaetota bacterium]